VCTFRALAMSESSLSNESLRAVADSLAQAESSRIVSNDLLAKTRRVIAEALFDQAQHRAATVSQTVVDARAKAAGLELDTVKLAEGTPLEILRSGARNGEERCLIAVLLAFHLEATLERRDGVSAIREMLPALDWLEFTGQYPPYSAVRAALSEDSSARFDDILRAAPVSAPTALAEAAVRAMRGAVRMSDEPRGSIDPGASVSISGEVEGFERALWWRVLTVAWSAVSGLVRTVLRTVFSLRSPATISLEGEQVRVAGHTEILGRTVRTFDVRVPLANLTEVRREARFPMLPVVMSVFALLVGSTLGARYVIEGAGGHYWGVVALGLGLIAAGVLFDFVLRAIFPGVQGRTRLTLRGRDRRGMVLSGLDIGDLDRLLEALDARTSRNSSAGYLKPLMSGAEALSAETVREDKPRGRM
jgi:hypothetical protein